MKTIANIRVGKPQTTPSTPAHVAGIRQGNKLGGFDRTPGLHATEEQGAGRPTGVGTARRSTGINPKARNPIDPKMPNLSPA
jgi:hypothetical protein